jgi:NADH-quinone oxidoreductase subunit J
MIAFWILGAFTIATAIWTVTASKPIYSVVGLLFNFAALAVIYLTLQAEFLAVIQIVVYSGAILVLFLFVIALLSSGVAAFPAGPNRMPRAGIPAIVIVLAALGFLAYGVTRAAISITPSAVTASTLGPVGTADVFGSVGDFGKALFTTHLLPFEITALILMVAVIGVVLLAGDQTPYIPTRRRAAQVERQMREAILRGGDR